MERGTWKVERYCERGKWNVEGGTREEGRERERWNVIVNVEGGTWNVIVNVIGFLVFLSSCFLVFFNSLTPLIPLFPLTHLK